MKKIILICCFIFSTSAAISAEKTMGPEGVIIDGVSEFLKERAEDNFIYIFEHKVKKSEHFACYFPNTRSQLEFGHLKEWLLYPKALWEDTIKKDLELFALRSAVVKIEDQLNLSDKSTELAELYLRYTKDLEVLYGGNRYPLNYVGINKDSMESKIVNGFSDNLGDIVLALNTFRSYTTVCDAPTHNYTTVKKSIDALLNVKTNLEEFKEHIKKYGKNIRIKQEKLDNFCEREQLHGDCSTEKKVVKLYMDKIETKLTNYVSETYLANFIKKIDSVKSQVDTARAEETFTGAVIFLLNKIKKNTTMDDVDFQRLSSSALFFASISDSKSAAGVKEILKAYTVPAVSFYTKREAGNHIDISSYLGLSAGSYKNDVPEPQDNTLIFAPVGIEYSRGLSGSSVSVMLSPFDFAYPIAQKMNGNDDDANLSDVLAPSLTVSYGFPDMPLTIGIGYQQGRHIPALDETERRWLFFVGVDMPLWNIK